MGEPLAAAEVADDALELGEPDRVAAPEPAVERGGDAPAGVPKRADLRVEGGLPGPALVVPSAAPPAGRGGSGKTAADLGADQRRPAVH